jgi:Apoptosis inhibitory protein 5 (API5)
MLHYLQTKVESAKFVTYLCEDVLPILLTLPKNLQDTGSDAHLEILKLSAELCKFCSTLESPESKLQHVFNLLLVIFFRTFSFSQKINFAMYAGIYATSYGS